MHIRNANHIYKELLKDSEKFAIWITNKVGTIGFFAIIFFTSIIIKKRLNIKAVDNK